jgi:lipopolysaccharide heptosyltransferase II
LKLNKKLINKILIIKPGAIGDVLLSTPVIENLRFNFPDAEINYLTQKFCKDVLAGNPFISRILTYDLDTDSSRCILRNIRKQKYDLVIDLFCNPRTALITFLSGAKYRVGFKFNLRSYAYNFLIKPRSDKVHNIDFNLDTLRALGLEIISSKPVFYINGVHKEFADKFFAENGLEGSDVIGINPSGTWKTKVWYPEKFINLIKKLQPDFKVLIFWGYEEEKELAEYIKSESGGKAVLIPEVGLKYMGALLNKCRAFMTNDTGPMHIACALGVNTAAIFGPTKSNLQGPTIENSVIIKNEELDCLGCDLTLIEKCPNSHKCMEDLTEDYVYSKLMELIRKTE